MEIFAMKTALLSVSLIALFYATTPAVALTDADCAKAWTDADAKKAGMLTETEAPRYFGALHFAQTIDTKGLSQEQFVTYCKEGVFDVTAARRALPSRARIVSQRGRPGTERPPTDISLLP
jgi:hypothetical protein